jgi:hypothetical protein
MEDIVKRLRGWRNVHLARGGELFEEAAAEIDRLREAGKHSEKPISSPTLTDAERAAILTAADLLIGSKPGAIIRNLLERLGGAT